MAEKQTLQSEGALLDAFLDELQAEHAVKEISGWESGFTNLSRALDGILPGLYWLIGPPACGKTSFAKQLLDQVALHNGAPGVFFSFVEREKELRIKTLARLSGIENREIRRGSAYLLHWYGVPKRSGGYAEQLPPGWEKLRRSAEEAKSWLDLIYLVESGGMTLKGIEDQIGVVKQITGRDRIVAIIDDAQYLVARDRPSTNRLAIIAEQLQATAAQLNIPVIGVWPDLEDAGSSPPQVWADRAAADVILVFERDRERTPKLTEPNQPLTLHIVKNRGGERGKLGFDFFPAFARFTEVTSS